MGDLLGFATFRAFGAARLVAVLAVIWAGLVAVPPAEAADVVLLAAGDIADCSSVGDTATAALVGVTAGTVVTLGDNVYGRGTARQFANCYGPTWGRFKSRTRPSPGNHDYGTPGAIGYFNYFGAAAGPRGKGWYSYEAGDWHVVVLNSNCTVVACWKGSEQERWLRADLAAHSHQCTLAYWHHPRFSSDARHGNNAAVGPFWQALYDYGADLVLSGHAHDYERFAPQTPAGAFDPAFGIRQIVVGTGGRSHYGFGGVKPNSQVRNGTAFGVLKLTLHPQSYDWRFLPQAGKTFTDSGTAACHGRAAAAAHHHDHHDRARTRRLVVHHDGDRTTGFVVDDGDDPSGARVVVHDHDPAAGGVLVDDGDDPSGARVVVHDHDPAPGGVLDDDDPKNPVPVDHDDDP